MAHELLLISQGCYLPYHMDAAVSPIIRMVPYHMNVTLSLSFYCYPPLCHVNVTVPSLHQMTVTFPNHKNVKLPLSHECHPLPITYCYPSPLSHECYPPFHMNVTLPYHMNLTIFISHECYPPIICYPPSIT